jgi:hypothetical protein
MIHRTGCRIPGGLIIDPLAFRLAALDSLSGPFVSESGEVRVESHSAIKVNGGDFLLGRCTTLWADTCVPVCDGVQFFELFAAGARVLVERH